MITFTWFLDILHLGYMKNLELSDLGILPGVEQASSQYERFYKHYRFVDVSFNHVFKANKTITKTKLLFNSLDHQKQTFLSLDRLLANVQKVAHFWRFDKDSL